MRNQYEIKMKLQKKAYRIIFVRNINFFIARSPFYYIIRYYLCLLPPFSQVTNLLNGPYNPVDTRRRFNVYTTSETSYRRLIDVKTTSCVYWERCIILPWVVFYVMISWVVGQKYENQLQFNISWLVSLRQWYYFRLCLN